MRIHYRVSGEGIEIVRCFGTDSQVVIPEQIEGKPVIKAAPYAFSARKDKEEIDVQTYDTDQIGQRSAEEKLLAEIPVYRKKFEDAMDDDLNTADAISAIFELVKFANTNANDASSGAFVTALKKEIVALSDVLGLQVEKKEENLDAEIEKMIEERQAARKARDFKRADEIRDELLAQGIILEDTREGVKWKRA